MILELKKLFQAFNKQKIYKIFLSVIFISFLYIIYILYRQKTNLLVFKIAKYDDNFNLLKILSQNTITILTYLFAILLLGDICSSLLVKRNPLFQIRFQSKLKVFLSYLAIILSLSFIFVVFMALIYSYLANTYYHNTVSIIIYSIMLLATSLLLITFFNLINSSYVGYISILILLSLQPLISLDLWILSIIFSSIFILMTIIVFWTYSSKEII